MECRYRDAKCNSCGKIGHLKSVCKSKGNSKNDDVSALNVSCSSNECEFSVFSVGNLSELPKKDVVLNGVPLKMGIDSGAGVTVLTEKDFGKLKCSVGENLSGERRG